MAAVEFCEAVAIESASSDLLDGSKGTSPMAARLAQSISIGPLSIIPIKKFQPHTVEFFPCDVIKPQPAAAEENLLLFRNR
jgi:hypothetical protein